MNDIGDLYARLAAAVCLEGDDAAIRIEATYEPIGGPTDKVSPPTYPVAKPHDPPYLIERRWKADGTLEDTVLIDSRQSQANRCEAALQAEIDAGRLGLPHLVLRTVAHGRPLRWTSLEVPARSRDAYFRDSESPDGGRFDATAAGAALKAAGPGDASALFCHAPTDLVYGVWDSHRKLRLAPRFPRAYTSELVGHDVLVGRRAAGRFDLVVSGAARVNGDADGWEFGADGKGTTRLSELGHGSIPPSEFVRRPIEPGGPKVQCAGPGGVTVRSVTRTASVGLTGLARVTLGPSVPADGDRAARTLLAALALLGDRLAFARAGLFLRSGCELVRVNERLSWVGGSEGELQLDIAAARALMAFATERAVEAGLKWDPNPLPLRPNAGLQQAIEESFFVAADAD
jgi:CRISPR-associated protein Csb1